MKKLILLLILNYICFGVIAQNNSHNKINHTHTTTQANTETTLNQQAQAQVLHTESVENLVYKFLENKNQWETEIKFRATIPSGMLSLKNNSLIYSFYDSEPFLNRHRKPKEESNNSNDKASYEFNKDGKIKAHGVEVKILGANPNPSFETTGEGTEAYNFFFGNNAAKWASDVKSYTGLAYKNLYKGVDMRFYSYEDVLKYEFIVAPNTDTKQIRLEYFGANKVELENGNLKISTTVLNFIEQHPYCYQEIDGKKIEVPANFVLENNILSYNFPQGYNPKYALVIDPTLIFSTYSGSISDNWGYTATFDNAGNLYSGGIVAGQQMPVTVGAFDATFGGIWDTAIFKYNPTGTNALYITFLGGTATECPNSMIVNNAGNLVIMGSTGSADFPTSATAFDRSFNGGTSVNIDGTLNYPQGADFFIMILNSTGNTMVNSTFVGGTGNDGLATPSTPLLQNYGDEFRGEVNIDASDNIYVAAGTNSINFPTTNGITAQGGQDGVAFRLNSTLSNLTWSSYVGGNQEDIVYNIKVATNGDIFICGATTSSNFPITAGALQVAYSGAIDGFVQRYNAAGVLQNGSYIGTTSYDATFMMDIDTNNDVFLFGNTKGIHPVSAGVYMNAAGGHFIYKLNNTLTTRIWSTQIGVANTRTPSITPTAFMVNDCGNIYVAGWGGFTSQFSPTRNSTMGLPVTSNALRGVTTGDDFYLMILGKNATSLLYGTFFGGTSSVDGDHVDGGTSRFSKNGVIYHAVCACRDNRVPSSQGAWRTTNSAAPTNGCNNLAFKIDLDPFTVDFVPIDVATNLVVDDGNCAPVNVRLRNDSKNATSYQWNLGIFGTSTLAEPVVNIAQGGTYTFTLTASNSEYCLGPITVTKRIRLVGGTLSVSPDVAICRGQSTNLTASGATAYSWTPITGLSNPNIANPIATPTQTTTYTLTGQVSQNCRQQKTVIVTVSQSIEPKFTVELSDLCATFPLVSITNQSDTGGTYTWDFGNGQTFVGQNPPRFRYTNEGTFNIKLTTNLGSTCSQNLSKPVLIQRNNNVIIPTISPNAKLCEGDKTQLLATGGTTYSWTPITGLSNPNIPNPIATAIRTITYTVRIGNNSNGMTTTCFRDTSVTLSVSPTVIPKFTARLTNDCELFPLVTLTNQSVGALAYSWNFGNGQTSTAENPQPFRYAKSGTYRIILSVSNVDCSKNDTLNLKIDENTDNEFIKFIELAPNQNICVGDTAKLSATAGTTYSWTPTTSLNNATIANPIATPTQTTRYTVRITNKLGCFKDTSILVDVAPKIVLDFDVILEELCEPYPLTRIVSRVTGADTYTWTFGNGQTFVGIQPPPYKYTADGNYTISVTGKNRNCERTNSKKTLQTYLIANDFYKQIRVIPRNPNLCLGDKVQLNASGGFRYLWTPATGLSNANIANPIANPAQSTVYNVRISNERGCFVDSLVTVNVVPELKVDFELQVSSECGKNGVVKFINKTTGTGQYKWFLGDGRTLDAQNPADNSYDKSGEYEVILEVFNGICSRTKSQKIKVENVNPPNVITPNGDGKNEKFVIDNVRNDWKIEIYDRWGKQIYKTDNYQNDWGINVTNALYYYFLTSPEGKTCKGWVLVAKGEN